MILNVIIIRSKNSNLIIQNLFINSNLTDIFENLQHTTVR